MLTCGKDALAASFDLAHIKGLFWKLKKVDEWRIRYRKEEKTAREHSLTDSTVFVTNLTAIDELGKDLKSAEILVNITQKEGRQQLRLSLIL